MISYPCGVTREGGRVGVESGRLIRSVRRGREKGQILSIRNASGIGTEEVSSVSNNL